MYYLVFLKLVLPSNRASFMRAITLFVACFLATTFTARGATAHPDFDALVQAIYRDTAPEVPYAILEKRLWALYQSPLPLNSVTRTDLERLGILTEEQISNFLQFVASYGPLASVYELHTIPGFDAPTIRQLLPFVCIGDNSLNTYARSMEGYGLLRYCRVMEQTKGYSLNKKNIIPYQGTPDHFLGRLHLQHPMGWGLGYIINKQPGETSFYTSPLHHSEVQRERFHWSWSGQNRLQKLIIGDYEVGYGEGLMLDAGFSMGHGDVAQVIMGNNRGLRPHTSLAKVALRGVAATWRWNYFGLTTYYSSAALDGKVATKDANKYVQSLSRGGSYRTEGEIAKKGQVREKVMGATVTCQDLLPGASAGVNGLCSFYSLPICPDLRRGNPHRFSGEENWNGSFFYRFLWKNLHFFGEKGASKSGGQGAVFGVLSSWTRYLDVALLWRDYTQDFHALHGNAFRENSTGNSNERGLYLSGSIRPWKNFYINGYYDTFSFPWFHGKPAQGHSWLAKATYQPTKTARVKLQHKVKSKARKIPKSPQIAMGTRQTTELQLFYQFSRQLGLKHTLQCSRYQLLQQTKWGYAVVQDLVYRMRKLQLKGRLAYFSSDDKDTALYFYEPNFLYTGFNFRPYQGQGERFCILAVYRPMPAVRFEIKHAVVHYRDKTTIGSGNEAIAGNLKNEFNMQLILKH